MHNVQMNKQIYQYTTLGLFNQGLCKSKKPYHFIIFVSDFQHSDLHYTDYAFKVFK